MLKIAASTVEHGAPSVRESGHFLVNSVLTVVAPLTEQLTGSLVPMILRGLEDSIPQVRYAASVSARTFVKNGNQSVSLLPAISLNRFYVAEGVQRSC